MCENPIINYIYLLQEREFVKRKYIQSRYDY